LDFFKHIFRIYYTLLEHNRIPLVPDRPNYCCPNPFPDQILTITNLEQVEALKVDLYVVMLDEQDTNPPKAHGPNTHGIFTLQKEMLARFILV